MVRLPAPSAVGLLQSPVNPKLCGTFSSPTSKSPFFFFSSRQSLSCCLSRVAERSTPKPHGSLYSPSELHGPSYSLQNLVVLSLIHLRTAWSSSLMAAAPRFKSQCPSSSVAPFPTPPTISYTCQHPCILPALLGCHNKPRQVWPHGVEPIFSKLSCRPCNQGELLPSPILGGIWSHPPGKKRGHSYLTYP